MRDQLVLYRDKFSLQENLSFSSFVKVLDNEIFSPYVLLVGETHRLNEYLLEFQYIPPIIPFQNRPFLVDWKSLDYCVLRYLEADREVSLEASISIGWLFLYLLLLGSMSAFMIYGAVIAKEPLLFLGIFVFVLPLALLYNRGVKRYKRIRSLAGKPAESKLNPTR